MGRRRKPSDEEAVTARGMGRPWSGLTTCEGQFDVASFLLGALTLPEEREWMTHVAAFRTCQAVLQ